MRRSKDNGRIQVNPNSVLILEDTTETMQWLSDIVANAFPAAIQVKATTLQESIALCKEQEFDLALVDLGLPDGSGLDLIRSIRADAKSSTYIVVATIYDDDTHLMNALRLGANGYLLKDDSREKILNYLKGIEDSRAPVSSRALTHILHHFNDQGRDEDEVHLTQREEDVLRVIAKGYSVSEAASMLGLSVNTVKSYLKTVYAKLGITSRAEATTEALKRRLIDL